MKKNCLSIIKNVFLGIKYVSFEIIEGFIQNALHQFDLHNNIFCNNYNKIKAFENQFLKVKQLHISLEDAKVKQKEATKIMQEQFRLLSANKIKRWNILIQTQYLSGTPEYNELLGNYRKPFQSGNYASRLHAVEILNISLEEYDELHKVKEDIHAFLFNLKESIKQKKQCQQNKKINEILFRQSIQNLIESLHICYVDLFPLLNENKSLRAAIFDFNLLKVKQKEKVINTIKLSETNQQNAEQTHNQFIIQYAKKIQTFNQTFTSKAIAFCITFYIHQYFCKQNKRLIKNNISICFQNQSLIKKRLRHSIYGNKNFILKKAFVLKALGP